MVRFLRSHLFFRLVQESGVYSGRVQEFNDVIDSGVCLPIGVLELAVGNELGMGSPHKLAVGKWAKETLVE